MKPEDLKDWQKKFLEDLMTQDWTIGEPVPEPEPSVEEKAQQEIMAAKDYEELKVKPKILNPFKNFSATVHRSKSRGKQIVCLYLYRDVKREGVSIGREGGICRRVPEDYKKETMKELEYKYPVAVETAAMKPYIAEVQSE